MSLAEKLSREVARAAALRQRYLLMSPADPGDDVGAILQRILHIETILENAHLAAGSSDPIDQVQAVFALQECAG